MGDFPPTVEVFLRFVAFFLGASIGSFLNVVIYRVPLGISVHDPRRSFCPNCRYQIPWYCNIPIFSWIALRGKCANCGQPISVRYVAVEFVTALLFLIVWEWFYPQWVIFPYWVLVCLFVVTVFVDFDHFIIPDEVTKGGMVAGVVCSALVPALMGVTIWWQGLLWSIFGAAVGLGLLWLVVEAGKKAFGRLELSFVTPEPLRIAQDDEAGEPVLEVAGDRHPWSELFFRKSDRLLLKCADLRMISKEGVTEFGEVLVTVDEDGFSVAPPEGTSASGGDGEREAASSAEPARRFELESLEEVAGAIREVVIPREAMGFGDVKFMGMVGAFLGWKAVLFTLFAASILGTAVALPARLTGRQEWASKIPFGPYLVLGAMVWLFLGEWLLEWYFGLGRSAP